MSQNPQNIRISDYNYPLPEERIAKYPLPQRDSSKLLIYNKGKISHTTFRQIPELLPKGELMIFNNTRVIQARLHFRKTTGALIEVFMLEPYAPADYELMFQSQHECQWLCLVGNLKKWKEGILTTEHNGIHLSAEHSGTSGTSQIIRLSWDTDNSFAEIIDIFGELPIPPYLNRDTEESDKTTYQTVYSKIKGSVAAPTAGLHFTPAVLAEIDAHGIEREELTLHVGAGTFRPVKSELISGHDMHTEYVSVRLHTIERLLAHDCKAIAVGTTSVRTLESLYYIGCHILQHPDHVTDNELHVQQWEPYEDGIVNKEDGLRNKEDGIKFKEDEIKIKEDGRKIKEDGLKITYTVRESLEAIRDYLISNHLNVLNASTQIIIAPGYTYKIVSRLITNFHQPQSTLLLLVSALVGEDWHRIYDYALANDFRFLSYGDSSLLIP